MPKLELTGPEAALMWEVAEERLSLLRVEIHRTDNRRYRESLKERESLLAHVVERLGTAIAVQT